MQTIYLKDGRMADLVTKTEKGYLVDPYITWNDYEGNPESSPSGQVELVSEVFNTAPTELIEAEYKKVVEKVQRQEKIWLERQKDLQKLNHEIGILRNQKTDLSRYIINREELRNAKRLIVFEEHHIVPVILDGTKSRRFTVSYEISQYKDEEKCWSYKLWSENRESGWRSGNYFDPEYGILIDLSDEQIKEVALARLSKKPKDYFYSNGIMGTPDEWLTPEYIETKRKLLNDTDQAELEKAKDELRRVQAKIDQLSGQLITE